MRSGIHDRRQRFKSGREVEVSSVLKARDIVPIISSNERRPPDGYAQEFSNRFAQIYQQSPPATVSAIYYVRDFCGCTGVPLRGWGYALKAQPNVGRFMIAQIA